jgi:hypothetical protein
MMVRILATSSAWACSAACGSCSRLAVHARRPRLRHQPPGRRRPLEPGGLLGIDAAVAAHGVGCSLTQKATVRLSRSRSIRSLVFSAPAAVAGPAPRWSAPPPRPVDAVLAHPVTQGRVVDAQLPGDRSDRLTTAVDQLDRVTLELLGESSTGPLGRLSVFLSREDILSSEVSCLRGRSPPRMELMEMVDTSGLQPGRRPRDRAAAGQDGQATPGDPSPC